MIGDLARRAWSPSAPPSVAPEFELVAGSLGNSWTDPVFSTPLGRAAALRDAVRVKVVVSDREVSSEVQSTVTLRNSASDGTESGPAASTCMTFGRP